MGSAVLFVHVLMRTDRPMSGVALVLTRTVVIVAQTDSVTRRRRSSSSTGVPVWTLCLTLPAPLVDPAFYLVPFL